MKYSKEFQEKLKEVYPMFDAFHKMAENGDMSLITALEELCNYEISIFEVLDGLKTQEAMHNLFAKCQRMAVKVEIYSMAMEEYSKYEERKPKIIV